MENNSQTQRLFSLLGKYFHRHVYMYLCQYTIMEFLLIRTPLGQSNIFQLSRLKEFCRGEFGSTNLPSDDVKEEIRRATPTEKLA